MRLQDLPHSVLVLVIESYAIDGETSPARPSEILDGALNPVGPFALCRSMARAVGDVQDRYVAPPSATRFVEWAARLEFAVGGRAARVQWLIMPTSSSAIDKHLASATLVIVAPRSVNLRVLELGGCDAEAFDIVGAVGTLRRLRHLSWSSIDGFVGDRLDAMLEAHAGTLATLALRSARPMRDVELFAQSMAALRELQLTLPTGSADWLAGVTRRCSRLATVVVDTGALGMKGWELWNALEPVLPSIRVVSIVGPRVSLSDYLPMRSDETVSGRVFDRHLVHTPNLIALDAPSFAGFSFRTICDIPASLRHLGVNGFGVHPTDYIVLTQLVIRSRLERLAVAFFVDPSHAQGLLILSVRARTRGRELSGARSSQVDTQSKSYRGVSR